MEECTVLDPLSPCMCLSVPAPCKRSEWSLGSSDVASVPLLVQQLRSCCWSCFTAALTVVQSTECSLPWTEVELLQPTLFQEPCRYTAGGGGEKGWGGGGSLKKSERGGREEVPKGFDSSKAFSLRWIFFFPMKLKEKKATTQTKKQKTHQTTKQKKSNC